MIARALEAKKLSAADILRDAGLDPDKLNDPSARYPVSRMRKLWTLAAARSGDPAFGLFAVRYWHPSTLQALGFAWMASATLRDAMRRAARYLRLVSDAAMAEVLDEDDCVGFYLRPSPGAAVAAEAEDATVAILIGACRFSFGRRLDPKAVWMMRQAPADLEPYRRYFRSSLHFASDRAGIRLRREVVDARLPTGDADLARASEQVILRRLAELDHNHMISRLRAKLIVLLPAGEVSQEAAAAALNVSARTLQRRLEAEGSTFRRVVDETRRMLALDYLRESGYSLGEIGYLLGFSEQSNFNRAFRRWTGETPGTFRERLSAVEP